MIWLSALSCQSQTHNNTAFLLTPPPQPRRISPIAKAQRMARPEWTLARGGLIVIIMHVHLQGVGVEFHLDSKILVEKILIGNFIIFIRPKINVEGITFSQFPTEFEFSSCQCPFILDETRQTDVIGALVNLLARCLPRRTSASPPMMAASRGLVGRGGSMGIWEYGNISVWNQIMLEVLEGLN